MTACGIPQAWYGAGLLSLWSKGRVGSIPTSRATKYSLHIPLFIEYLRKYVREVTATTYLKRLELLAKVGDLDNPEQIRTLICTYQSTESFKELLTNAYTYYAQFKGYSWTKPRFTREDKPFFLPTESEIDQLISTSVLQGLKCLFFSSY